MLPALTSSQRTRPGRIGSPAASAEVHVSGRRRFESRSKIGAAPRTRVAVVPRGGEELVEAAGPALDDQRVPVRAALDRRPRVERVRAAVALVGVGEPDVRLRVTAPHDVEREPVRGRPEVRVQVRGARVGRTQPGLAQLVDRKRRPHACSRCSSPGRPGSSSPGSVRRRRRRERPSNRRGRRRRAPSRRRSVCAWSRHRHLGRPTLTDVAVSAAARAGGRIRTDDLLFTRQLLYP